MTYEFKDANGWHILFSDFDFECAEHIELATWNDGKVYMRDPIDGAWSVHTFTGV